MNKVLCAAIVPIYNAEKYISYTLDSLLAQTSPLERIIVVDDCSTDRSAELIRNTYGNRVDYYLLPENKGVSNARNTGASLANSDYILFMDGDDVALPSLVERSLNRIQLLQKETGDSWHLSHSAYELINADNQVISDPIRWRQVKSQETLGHQFVRNHIISASGVIVQRDAFLKQGGFRTDFSLCEDVELWTRMAHHSGYAYVDEVLVQIRRHPENTSRNLLSMLGAEKRIFDQYSLVEVRQAIYARELPDIDNIIDYVGVLYRLERWQEGYLEIGNAKQNDASHHRLQFYRGLYHLHQSDWEAARYAFTQSEQLYPGQGATLNNLGALAYLRGEIELARHYYEKALELYPNYLDAQHNRDLLQTNLSDASQVRFTWRELRPVLTNYSEYSRKTK